VLSPYRPPLMTPEREKAVQHAIDVMAQGLPWGGTLRRFGREEMLMTSACAREAWGKYLLIWPFLRLTDPFSLGTPI
jgi:hypothetical protein